MVEAILLNKEVIEPKLFPKNENDKSFMFSENFKNATIKVDNLDQAQKAIDSKNLITDANDKKKLVDYYFGLCDGKVFDRFISQL